MHQRAGVTSPVAQFVDLQHMLCLVLPWAP